MFLSDLSLALADYLVCKPRTANGKTDSVPTAYVREEYWPTGCSSCPRYSGGDCYAIFGRTGFAMKADRPTSMAARSVRVPQEYTLRYALAGAPRSARVFRWSAVGDSVGSVPRDLLEAGYRACVAEGLHPIDYTSTWRRPESRWARAWAMASCHSVEDVWEALADGWRTTLTVDPDAMADAIEAGKTSMRVESDDGGLAVVGRMCPAMVADYRGDRPVSCNDCMLCSVEHLPAHPNRAKAGIDVVLFALHGIRGIGHRWTRRKKAYRARVGGEA